MAELRCATPQVGAPRLSTCTAVVLRLALERATAIFKALCAFQMRGKMLQALHPNFLETLTPGCPSGRCSMEARPVDILWRTCQAEHAAEAHDIGPSLEWHTHRRREADSTVKAMLTKDHISKHDLL